ncbi:uroporphyrinogen-III synthase [Inhella gelatinilytica]|uniref:Uroporphyrinogen-III synthase n=1 Tax=Inhella gelatinilytica TaxID=2795030 RepID=A0A931NBC5_9BURK|nr:uroporphyrinogen-III synthase [Inhella gelatinilytica]MBH9553428.1 uroporphyrinogen-III synthase [Inhella gelatinilytica]
MTAPLILTAPAAQQGRWQSALTALGVEVQGVPLIDIVVAPLETLESAWAAVMRGPRLVIFVSPSAVAALDAVAGLKWIGWPRPVMTGCVGPATAQALRLRGVRDVVSPAEDSERFESEALWPLLRERGGWQGASVLMLRGDGGREWLADQLAAEGAAVQALSVYQRVCPDASGERQAAVERLRGAPALWLLTSAQALKHGLANQWIRPGDFALATHPRIAEAAHREHLRVELVRSEPEAVAAAWRTWAAQHPPSAPAAC